MPLRCDLPTPATACDADYDTGALCDSDALLGTSWTAHVYKDRVNVVCVDGSRVEVYFAHLAYDSETRKRVHCKAYARFYGRHFVGDLHVDWLRDWLKAPTAWPHVAVHHGKEVDKRGDAIHVLYRGGRTPDTCLIPLKVLMRALWLAGQFDGDTCKADAWE